MSLKGSDTTTGGNIIMPIDMSTEATTRSMMRNGRKSKNPISKARLSSEIMKADEDPHRQIFRALRLRLARHVHDQPQILFADVLLHETAQWSAGAVEGLVDAALVGCARTSCDTAT